MPSTRTPEPATCRSRIFLDLHAAHVRSYSERDYRMPNKILIVDDEPFNLDLLEQELSDLGYAVVRAETGAGALTQIDQLAPDLVLLDYLMPGMNGIEVLQLIRKTQNDLPIVMITAYGTIDLAGSDQGRCRRFHHQTI